MSEPGIGHNQPPDPIAAELGALRDRHDRLFDRAAELKAAAAAAPAAIADEETAGKVAELRRMLRTCVGELEQARKIAKAPWDRIAKSVHDLFLGAMDPLTEAVGALGMREGAYLQRLRDEEERKRKAALREAQERAAAAERERQAAEKLAAEADAEQAKANDAMAAVQLAAQARDAQQAADAALREAEQQAAETVKVASVGAYGARTSLRKVWRFRNLDLDKVSLAELRRYLSRECIEKAITAAIKDGARTLQGVEIFEDVATTNR